MLKNKHFVYLITQSKFGGAQKYIVDLANYFKQNNTVTVAVGRSDEADPLFLKQLQEIGIKVEVLEHLKRDIDPWENIRSVLEIRRLLWRLKPDILHINSSMAGAVGSLGALLYNLSPFHPTLKVVYTAHGFVFNEPRPWPEKKLFLMIEKLTAAWKSLIICVSDFDRQSALKHHLTSARKLLTIHNGLSLYDYRFLDKQAARAALNLKPDDTIIGVIASLYPTKGLPYLLQAVKQLSSNVKIVIIGEGPERPKLEALIKELALTNIQLIGSRPDGWQYLKAFDLFVLPSVKEGLPYTILEAGLAELPVIATTVGGIPEIITNQQSGLLVPSQDPTALAQACQQLLSDKKRAGSLAQQLHKNILTNFSLDRLQRQTEEAYELLVAGAAPMSSSKARS